MWLNIFEIILQIYSYFDLSERINHIYVLGWKVATYFKPYRIFKLMDMPTKNPLLQSDWNKKMESVALIHEGRKYLFFGVYPPFSNPNIGDKKIRGPPRRFLEQGGGDIQRWKGFWAQSLGKDVYYWWWYHNCSGIFTVIGKIDVTPTFTEELDKEGNQGKQEDLSLGGMPREYLSHS